MIICFCPFYMGCMVAKTVKHKQNDVHRKPIGVHVFIHALLLIC
jgi:hypothetical protein